MIIVVDTNLFPKKVLDNNNFLNLFPQEENDHALRFDLDELLEISKLESEYINKNIDNILDIFLKNNIYPNKHYKLILRMYFAASLNVFIDRALRTLYLNKNFDLKSMKVLSVGKITNFDSGVTTDMIGYIITESGHGWQFNQDILFRMLRSLGIEAIEKNQVFRDLPYPEYDLSTPYKNLLFYPEKNVFINKVFNKIKGKMPKLVKSIPTFDVAQEIFYFKKSGLFGPLGIFKEFNWKEVIVDNKDKIKRKKISSEIFETLNEVASSLLKKIDKNIVDEDIDKIASTFPSFFIDYFPTSCLETAELNVNNYLNELKCEKSKYVFGHGIAGQNGIFAATAAKICSKKIIGFQHGGQYGYIEDLFQFAQTEYDVSDIYVTWGWSDDEIDDHLPKFKSISLPAPQFSEKSKKLPKNYFTQKTFASKPDILFISNKFNRFPFSCSGGTNRIDFIDKFKAGIRSIVLKAKEKDNSIVIKVYSKNRYELLKSFWNEMKSIGGNKYKIYDSWDKGLSTKLLTTAKLIVWDQIGTGTLQCFTANIPSIVYWERFHSRETNWSKPYIKGLEDVGIVHNSLDTLFTEIDNFIRDPILWMNDRKRRDAIDLFNKRYAYTDKKWVKIWNKQIKRNFLQ